MTLQTNHDRHSRSCRDILDKTGEMPKLRAVWSGHNDSPGKPREQTDKGDSAGRAISLIDFEPIGFNNEVNRSDHAV